MLSESVTEVTSFYGKPTYARANVLPESAVTRVTRVTRQGRATLWPASAFQGIGHPTGGRVVTHMHAVCMGYPGRSLRRLGGPFRSYLSKTFPSQFGIEQDGVRT